MRAGIYKRVSVIKTTVDGTSLDVQQERLESYAKSQGWDVTAVYEDAGISAKDTNRPDLQRMLKDAENGKLDVILVYKLDRLSRSVSDFHRLSTFLDIHKVALVSVSQHLDTTSPTGRLLRNILVDFANFERELITERVVDNKNHRAAEGKLNGGMAPYGYILVNKKAVIVPEEAIKVREVYSLYLNGRTSMRNVARLTGISFSQVEMILMNPFYAGKTAYNKTKYKNQKGKFERKAKEDWIIADGEHEPMVTYEEWLKVQEIKKSKKNIPDERNAFQLFKNLCYCGLCGRKMYFFRGTKDYNYYRCYDYNRDEGCGLISVRHNELEEKVIRLFNSLTSDKSWWKKVDTRKLQSKHHEEAEQRLKYIDQQISKADQQIARLVKQMADKDIAHLIKPQLMELETERKRLRDSRLPVEVVQSPMLTADIMKEIASNWKRLTTEEKMDGISIIVEQLTADKDKVILKWTDPNLPEMPFQLDLRASNGIILAHRF